jgi:hypothetical protein
MKAARQSLSRGRFRMILRNDITPDERRLRQRDEASCVWRIVIAQALERLMDVTQRR